MNITIRNISDEIIEKIRTLSRLEKRSLNSEILMVLECGVNEEMSHFLERGRHIPKETQIDIWRKLAGEWDDERETEDIIKDIYESRTLGREVEL